MNHSEAFVISLLAAMDSNDILEIERRGTDKSLTATGWCDDAYARAKVVFGALREADLIDGIPA